MSAAEAPARWANRIVGYQNNVDAAGILANPRNARTHPVGQRAALTGALDDVGWVTPILVNRRTGFLVDGHLRVEEAAKRGEPVPVMWLDLTDQEEAEILATFDPISTLATYDNDLMGELLGSFTPTSSAIQTLVDDLAAASATLQPLPPRADPDRVPPAPAAAISAAGDVWLLESPNGLVHRVMCGRSETDIPTLMGGVKAQLVWTDPPYGISYMTAAAEQLAAQNHRQDGKTVDGDSLDAQDLHRLLTTVFAASAAVCRRGAPWYVCAPPGPLYAVFGAVTRSAGIHRQTLIWVKQQLVFGRSDYHYRHEPIIYGWVPGAKRPWAGDRSQDSVLEFDRPARSDDHPTMKPVELVTYCIRNSSKPKAVVLDPFAGSGTTVIACELEQRICHALESKPEYVDVICRRWQDVTGIRPRLEATGEAHDFTA